MKTNLFFSVWVLLLCGIACSENKDTVYLKNFSYTECPKDRSDSPFGESSLTYKAMNESTLKVEISNLLLNCALEKINIDMNHSENDHINIHLQPIGDDANCLCPRDLTCEIGNLVQGKSYSCTITNGSLSSASFDFQFTANTSGEININGLN